MTSSKETVIVKIHNLSGYLQNLIEGVAKSPEEGHSIMVTFERGKAKEFEKGSDELAFVEKVLNHNGVQYDILTSN